MFTRRFFLRKILSRVNIYPFVEKALGAFPLSLCRSTFGAIADRFAIVGRKNYFSNDHLFDEHLKKIFSNQNQKEIK